MQDLLDPLPDRSFKGFPHTSPALRRSQIAAQRWNLLDGDLPLTHDHGFFTSAWLGVVSARLRCQDGLHPALEV